MTIIAMVTTGSGQMMKINAELLPMGVTDAVHAGNQTKLLVSVKLPEGYHMQSNQPSKPMLVPTFLILDLPKGIKLSEVVYPKPIQITQDGMEGTLDVFEREYLIGVSIQIDPEVTIGEMMIPIRLKYQPCDESMCYPPTESTVIWPLKVVSNSQPLKQQHADLVSTVAFGSGVLPDWQKSPPVPPNQSQAIPPNSTPPADFTLLESFNINGKSGGFLNAEAFLTFLHQSEKGLKETGMFEGRGPFAIVLLVLLGGFALNLTPCVLPMIPINLAIIGAGAQSGSRRRGFLLGATYGAGMAMTYGVLGLVVILTAGTFGTLNSSPWFNLGISLLFLALGLAMFDVFLIDFSRWSNRFNPTAKRGSVLLAFSMGTVAALLAGACVAPVVIQVILFSSNLYASGTMIALMLPFFLGIGMATPWPLAGAGMAALPKPGMWMKRVKQGFGVLIVASSMYYGYLSYELFQGRLDIGNRDATVEENGWIPSWPEGLQTARNEHKPVFIDFWASWCKNCLTMEQTTFKDPKVQDALKGYVKIRLNAEHPDEEPIRSLIQRFQTIGLPSYVILSPKSR